MSPNPHASRPLPDHVNLEQQKKQARELLRAARAQDPAAVQRIRVHHPQLTGRSDRDIARASLALHDAQIVLAREYGWSSWTALKREIERRQRERQTRVFGTDITYFEDRVAGLSGQPPPIDRPRPGGSWSTAPGSAAPRSAGRHMAKV